MFKSNTALLLVASVLGTGGLLRADDTIEAQRAAVAKAEDAKIQKLPLAARRAVKSYRENVLKPLLAEIDAAAKMPVVIEIDWTAIANPEQSDRYNEPDYWTNIFFVPLRDALKDVVIDDDGKEAFAKAVKKIMITFDEKTAPVSSYINGLALNEGVLTINWASFVNSRDVAARKEALVKFLGSKL